MANPMGMSAPSRGPAEVCGRRDFFFEGITLLNVESAVFPDDVEPDGTALELGSVGVEGRGCFLDEMRGGADEETSADFGGA